MPNELLNKTALITGGSRGLGKEISRAMASEGAITYVNYANRQEDAEAVVQDITNHGGTAYGIRADITSEEGARELIHAIEQKHNRQLDIIVNNATGPQPMLSIEDSSWQAYMDQLIFCVKAPLLLLKQCVGGMKERRFGRIINIGSEVVQIGNAEFASYVTAKSAMLGMTRSWANELGPYGITVNLIAPGFIPVERHANVPSEELQRYASQVPLQHMGIPQDVADAVVFLASTRAKFITGQMLAVNGGNTFGV